MVAASMTDGSLTSVLQPASVAKATPATATRRIENGIVRMIESSELDVEPDHEAAARRSGEHVGIEQLVDTRVRGTDAEDFGIVALVVGLPEPEVAAAEGDGGAGDALRAQERGRHHERDADLAEPDMVGLLHEGILHV